MPAFDVHKNFAYSTVLTAPSPASSGTSLVVQSGDGVNFPAVPFNAVVWPSGQQALFSNAEVVRVTNVSTDTFTITRTQESTNARTIGVGDQFGANITLKLVTDIEQSLNSAIVPQKPTAGYTVAANTQVMFFTNIDMTAANGDLIVNGLMQGIH